MPKQSNAAKNSAQWSKLISATKAQITKLQDGVKGLEGLRDAGVMFPTESKAQRAPYGSKKAAKKASKKLGRGRSRAL
jgi:hypothetical protein